MKNCFMIMGFGKKMDFRNSKVINLDLTYSKIIKPLFEKEFSEYKLLRGDEINYSGCIDTDMYRQLLDADLVIADITTSNENAIYELGVRHALRPASTIILLQKGEKEEIPFDYNHFRIIFYKDLEMDPDNINGKDLENKLREYILNINESRTDSPVYTYLRDLNPPVMCRDKQSMSAEQQEEKETIASLTVKANDFKEQKRFVESAQCWEKLHEMIPHYAYVVQQYALTTYKSRQPDTRTALENGLKIIMELNPDVSLDLETLGISGAICKRLYVETNENKWLERAIRYYKKGFMIDGDYYNGENYANCLLKKLTKDIDDIEFIALNYERKNVCRQILNNLASEKTDFSDVWKCASFAICSLHLHEKENFEIYRSRFMKIAIPWMKDTFEESVRNIESDFLIIKETKLNLL